MNGMSKQARGDVTAGIVGKQRQEGRRQGGEELLSSGRRVRLARAWPPRGAGPLAGSPLRAVRISACCAHCMGCVFFFLGAVPAHLHLESRAGLGVRLVHIAAGGS